MDTLKRLGFSRNSASRSAYSRSATAYETTIISRSFPCIRSTVSTTGSASRGQPPRTSSPRMAALCARCGEMTAKARARNASSV